MSDSWAPSAKAVWFERIFLALLILASVYAYGRWQYHRGFDLGADTTICVFAVSIEGPNAADTHDACKNVRDRNYVIDGFEPHAATTPARNTSQIGEG